jgi:hypothetical protein
MGKGGSSGVCCEKKNEATSGVIIYYIIIDYCVATYNHFYELPVYQTCRAFREKISSIVRKYFPKSEEFLLKAQIFDSGRSITQILLKDLEGFIFRKTSGFAGRQGDRWLKHQNTSSLPMTINISRKRY